MLISAASSHRRLEGIVEHLPPSVQSLDLGTNELCWLADALTTLSRMKQLKQLALKGNPCCIKPGYKEVVYGALGRQLASLDAAPSEHPRTRSPSRRGGL